MIINKRFFKTSNNLISNIRFKILFFAFVISFSFIVIKLVYISLFSDLERNGVANNSLQTNFSRANIYDRNNVLLATNLTIASLYVDSKIVRDPEYIASNLAKLFPKYSKEYFLSRINSKRKGRHLLLRDVTPKEELAINTLGFVGTFFHKDEKRAYIHSNLLSNPIGYVNTEEYGISGIEKYFNDYLSTKKKNLTLSIDVRVQHIVRRYLERAFNEFKAYSATAVVMDVRNGEIIAMVSLPDFNPYEPSDIITDKRYNNHASFSLYEAGSIFKVFNTAAALDYGIVKETDTYDVSNPINMGRFKITDYHPINGLLSVGDILKHSSNIGSIKIAQDLGSDKQKEFFKKIGLLSPLSIELHEKSSPLYPKKFNSFNNATLSYGYGMSITLVHLAQAMSAIVNGGYLYQATLLKNGNDKVKPKRVIEEETSVIMRRLLRNVVKNGTGRKADVAGYLVGGKTGTANKLVGNKYDENKLFSSFVGVFPMDKPKYVVIALFDEPIGNASTGGFATGGIVSAPVIAKIIEGIAPILDVMPQKIDIVE